MADTTGASEAAEAAQAGLDTPDSARRPQVGVDPQEELFVMLTASLRSHIFGKAEQSIARRIGEAGDQPGRIIGEMTFAMVSEVAHQAEERKQEVEYDTLLGVATEVIDDICDLAEASGIEVPDDQREYALLYAQQLYVDQQNPTEDQRETAKQDLALMKQDGSMDEATKYVQMRGTENGADPFDVAGMSGGNKPGVGIMGGEGNGE